MSSISFFFKYYFQNINLKIKNEITDELISYISCIFI